jgi:hypothetical protein
VEGLWPIEEYQRPKGLRIISDGAMCCILRCYGLFQEQTRRL